MAYSEVMAKAFRGEPWRCFALRTTDRAAFLAGADTLEAIEAGECEPVGFPIEDVFEFDAEIYDRLQEQWKHDGRTDDTLWRSARPYTEPRAA
jgi:hypothetical protein